MKDSIFSYISKFVVVILVVLLVVSFAVSGVGTSIQGINSDIVATVGDIEISNNEYRNAVRYELQKARGGLGHNINEEMQRIIEQRTLSTLIGKKLLMQETNRLGIKVGEKHIIDNVKSDPAFHIDGSFSQERYKLMLGQLGENDKTYYQSLQRSLSDDMLIEALYREPIISTKLTELLHQYEGEKRDVRVLSIPADYIKKIDEPTDAELKEYFQQHQEEFSAPEYRTISYITLDIDDVKDEIALTDKQLQEYYDENIDEFSTGEVRNFEQIYLSDEAIIKDIYDALQAGGDFYKLAQEKASQDKKALQYGDTEKRDLSGLFEQKDIDAMFALQVDEYTKPTQSILGWHIYRLKAIEQPRVKTFIEAKKALKEAIFEQEAGDILYQLAANVEDELAGGASFEEVSNKLNLKIKHISEINLDGQTIIDTPKNKLPKFGEFLETAFAMEVNIISPLVASDDGVNYYALQVDSVTPSRLRLLEETRGAVITKWKSDKALELQIQEAVEISRRIADATPTERLSILEKSAKSMQLETKEIKSIYRSSFNESLLPRAAVDEIYKTNEIGATSNNQLHTNNSQIIAIVTKISPATADDRQFGMTNVKQSLTQEISQDLIEQFLANLRNRYPVNLK